MQAHSWSENPRRGRQSKVSVQVRRLSHARQVVCKRTLHHCTEFAWTIPHSVQNQVLLTPLNPVSPEIYQYNDVVIRLRSCLGNGLHILRAAATPLYRMASENGLDPLAARIGMSLTSRCEPFFAMPVPSRQPQSEASLA